MLHFHLLIYTLYYYQIFHQTTISLLMLEDGVRNTVLKIGMVKILTGMYHQ